MADEKHVIQFPDGSDPVKVMRNRHRPGAIIRQGPVAIFADVEVGQQIVDALVAVLAEAER